MFNNFSKENSYTANIIKGFLLGIYDSFDTLRHPIKNGVLPCTSFVFDSSMVLLQTVIRRYAYLAKATGAQVRIDDRILGLKQFGTDFVAASGPEQSGILTRIVVGSFSMGLIFKGALAAPLVSNKICNIYYFGRLDEPIQFKNLFHDQTNRLPEFKLLDKEKIRKYGSDSYIYDIIDKGKLVIAKEMLKKPIIRNNQKWTILNHHDLAQYKNVYAAGHIHTKRGYIELITRESGHYCPQGAHLGPMIEHVFIRHGFTEAKGKYKPFVLFEDENTVPKIIQPAKIAVNSKLTNFQLAYIFGNAIRVNINTNGPAINAAKKSSQTRLMAPLYKNIKSKSLQQSEYNPLHFSFLKEKFKKSFK